MLPSVDEIDSCNEQPGSHETKGTCGMREGFVLGDLQNSCFYLFLFSVKTTRFHGVVDL